MNFASFVGACDCHIHIMDSKFPTIANASVRNLTATVEDYRGFARLIGVSRGVIVQPSLYGLDNACTLAALADLGPEYRAIVVADDRVETATLRRWNELGVRGVRFNQIQTGATTIAMMPSVASRIADLGWHIQLHLRADDLVAHEAMLTGLPVPVVLDHFGRLNVPEADRTAQDCILRMLDTGRCWVKLSGAYLIDRKGAPYDAAIEFGRSLAAANPGRMLWGSDWPHVTETVTPQTQPLLDVAFSIVESTQARRSLLVDNPARLYGFGS